MWRIAAKSYSTETILSKYSVLLKQFCLKSKSADEESFLTLACCIALGERWS